MSLLDNPLSVIKQLYDKDPAILKTLHHVSKHFQTIIGKEISKIPLLNNENIEHLRPGSLVRYQGMVQDMLDPEFYLARYQTVNKITSEKNSDIGCFTDVNCYKPGEEIDFDDANNVTLERQIFYCIPVPGRNRTFDSKSAREDKAPQTTNRNKRTLEEDDDSKMEDESNNTEKKEEFKELSNSTKKVKSKSEENSESNGPIKMMLPPVDFCKNFPLKDEDGPSVLIKMYTDHGEFKLNDIVEFVCILSVDPVLAKTSFSEQLNEDESMVTWHDGNNAEEKAHCPPPSLVPRLHCVFSNPITTLNPHVIHKTPLCDSVRENMANMRGEVMTILTGLLGGDKLTAQYLLLHLISSVYGRVGAMCIGKLSLNITKCPTDGFAQTLYSVIKRITEKSCLMPLTVDGLNNDRYIPEKDYEANRLISGRLQLSNGTEVLLDETHMQPGKLDADGVRNLTAIGNIIQWQKLSYNFKYTQLEMETNLNILILSEGKSLLTCDCQLPLITTEVSQLKDLSEEQWQKLYVYLSIVRSTEYNLTNEIQKALEDDFVEMRKEDSKATNADSFYLLLTTARYMALSFGQTTLSSTLWTRAKQLDQERRHRIAS